MSDLIQANYRLLRVLPRFGIHLGFGDKSVVEVCRAQGVSMELFLLVCNISTFDDFLPDTAMFKGIDVEDIVLFLQNSHKYYLEQRIPEIRENLSSLEEGPVTSSVFQKTLVHCRYFQFATCGRFDVLGHFHYFVGIKIEPTCRLRA